MNAFRFIDGQQDCRDGKSPQSEDDFYMSGYRSQAGLQAIKEEEAQCLNQQKTNLALPR